ncbi:hypothetical protein [Sandarakinorhabdus sp. AAP62]|uniref:hypothetical protein n=1 Tax=Sandarakinorhabdus sp. AAP62 TaxID=1248916 RepID=UPI00035F9F27|nr:hypothetical protein [Sandarakinorhabdus sp. AAP62]
MTDQLPIDASDWTDDGNDGIATPGSNGLESLLDFVRDRLIAMVEDARDSLVGQVRGLTSLSDVVSDALGEHAAPVTRVLGDYAGSINSIADALEQKSVEELVEDGRELVRAQPGAAIGVAIAIGFLAGRMLKAARD